MNKIDSVFAKADYLVDIPYVETSFRKSINVKSTIPRSHGILMNDMKDVMFCIQYYMC